MTVSANITPDFQRDQILTGAIRLCGLLTAGEEPSPEQIEGALFHFRLALQELQSEGTILTTTERASLILVAGTSEYALPSDVYDVALGVDDAIGAIVSAGGQGETIVKTMSRGEWMNISMKVVSGRPSRCYIEKKLTTSAVFWPTPDDSTVTFRYSKVRLLKDSDTGANTTDLRRTWAPYMTYATAVGVALDNSKTEQASLFKNWADAKLAKCKAGDVQRGNIRFQLRHNARNW